MESNNNNKVMSREEELQQAADEWAEFYKHAEDVCDFISVRIAYKEGAAWADKHPKNVWHQADEVPENGAHILMECKLLDSKEFKSYNIDYKGVVNWEVLKRYFRISRWAYISDLLPKGGE